MKIVAWYTENSIYEKLFHTHLEPTLKEYNLDSHIIPMPNHKKWNINVAQKPLVIMHAIKELREPFVLLDVDCKITGEPTLFNTIDPEKYDIAYHTLDWSKWYNRPGDIKKEALTGTMWFNANDEVMNMVVKWYQHCANNPGADQPPFQNLMGNEFKTLRVYNLPVEYVWIDSLPNGNKPHVKPKGKVIIRHFQASRDCKRKLL